MKRDTVLATAEFSSKLRTYMVLGTTLAVTMTVIGIPFLPIVIPITIWWARRYYENLSCTLTPRHLVIKRGVLFRQEKSIPLEKITDLTLRHGPLLKYLGLTTLHVETAGQSQQAGTADANLTGIIDSRAFRDLVLEQRDRVAEVGYGGVARALGAIGESGGGGEASAVAGGQGAGGTAAWASGPSDPVLIEIRDALLRIEEQLRAGVNAETSR